MSDLTSKFVQWKEWLFGDDLHSIQKQIHNMIWDSAVFQCVNEARRYAPSNEKGEPELNGLVHAFINHSFFQTQALAIRRLLDKETREGKRSVISLYRLVHDMKQNFALLTRKNILDALNYPYEYEKGLYDYYQARMKGKTETDPGSYFNSKSMHDNIDFLAGVGPDNRNSNDTVREQVFEWLEQRLEHCEEIYDYVNKFIAHPATPESRNEGGASEIKITLGKLYEGHKIICETAEFIGLTLLYHSLGNFLVTPAYDQFEYFEKPWANEETVKELYEFWNEYGRETTKWNNWDWKSDLNEHVY